MTDYKLITLVHGGPYGWNGPSHVTEHSDSVQPVVSLNPNGGYQTMQIKTWPVGTIISPANLVTNPQFGNGSTGWYVDDQDALTVVSSAPVSLPADCTDAARFDVSDDPLQFVYPAYAVYHIDDEDPDVADFKWAPRYWVGAYIYNPGTADALYMTVAANFRFHKDEGDLDFEDEVMLYNSMTADTAFVWRTARSAPPSPDYYFKSVDISITFTAVHTPGEGFAWLTGFMLTPSADGPIVVPDYADGDSTGWDWNGTADDSISVPEP